MCQPQCLGLNLVAKTIAQEAGAVTSFANFAAAKKALGSIDGHDTHHIVEQCQAARSGFSKAMINSTDNLIRLPKNIHEQISRHYSRASGQGGTIRDMLNGKSFQEQLNYGLDIVNQALNGQLPQPPKK